MDRHHARAVESGKTLVRAASLGYGTDEESVAMRRFFEAGNQSVIDGRASPFRERERAMIS